MAINQDCLWSAIGGALVWWIVLGTALGWMPAGSAEQQAVERANTAVLDVLTPICVARFHQDSESEAKLKALKESPTWNQGDFVVKQGWATMPGNDTPENRIAKACASRIVTASTHNVTSRGGVKLSCVGDGRAVAGSSGVASGALRAPAVYHSRSQKAALDLASSASPGKGIGLSTYL